MQSLQYTIDSLCSSVTIECVNGIIKALLKQGPFTVSEIIPLIQTKDRSLDSGSANSIASSALAEFVQRGEIKIEGNEVFSALVNVMDNDQLKAKE
jgi:hypothetical protein